MPVSDLKILDRASDLLAIINAFQHALDVLTARIDAIEYQLFCYWSVVDSPLSPTESIERLRQLRSELPQVRADGTTSQAGPLDG
jgi:hypothetical protein